MRNDTTTDPRISALGSLADEMRAEFRLAIAVSIGVTIAISAAFYFWLLPAFAAVQPNTISLWPIQWFGPVVLALGLGFGVYSVKYHKIVARVRECRDIRDANDELARAFKAAQNSFRLSAASYCGCLAGFLVYAFGSALTFFLHSA